MSLWNSFLIAFSVLLPLINPLGSALVFLGLADGAPPKVIRSLARKIAIDNVIFLAIIELLGARPSLISSEYHSPLSSSPVGLSSQPWDGSIEREKCQRHSRNKEEECAPHDVSHSQPLEEKIF